MMGVKKEVTRVGAGPNPAVGQKVTVNSTDKGIGRKWNNTATQDPKTRQNVPNSPTIFSPKAISSAEVDHVLLDDWWLVKAEGKGLGVGGYVYKENSEVGVRGFTSAAISKRHRANVLETADGITITVTGILNRSRTHQNGFPIELYRNFTIGFPFDWEDYAAVVSGEDSADILASMRNSVNPKFKMSSGNNESNSLPFSIDDLPATKIRDIMMFSFGDSDYCSLVKNIFSDVRRMPIDSASGHMGSTSNLSMEHSCTVENVDPGTSATPTQKSSRGLCFAGRREGVSTRSMSRTIASTGSVAGKSLEKKTTKRSKKQ